MHGKFITFEGGEGSGKSTQIRIVADKLKSAGKDVLLTREPGGSFIAEKIRELFLSHHPQEKVTPMTEVLLMYAARSQHLEEIIKPALNKGTWVLCDRFADSTMAYQGYGHGVSKDFIQSLYTAIVGRAEPDLTLIFDAPPDICFKRMAARNKDRMEAMDKTFHERLYQGFKEIAKMNPSRCKLIDATASLENVTTAVLKTINSL